MNKNNLEMLGRIHSIESLGTVDGPGMRYVLFLQGCPMRCQYCHNPDTWRLSGGKDMSVKEVLEDYESYRPYLKGGGITCTGGEPLLQMSFVIALFTEAHQRGLHTCLDTSGITFRREGKTYERFLQLIEVTDLFLLDLKHIDSRSHQILTGCENSAILDFSQFLNENEKDVWIRHVVVPGITDGIQDLYDLGLFIGSLDNVKALEILPYHTMGTSKYEAMGIAYPLEGIAPTEPEALDRARLVILKGITDKKRERRLSAS